METKHTFELEKGSLFFIIMVFLPVAILLYGISVLALQVGTLNLSENLIGFLFLCLFFVFILFIIYFFSIKPYYHSKYIALSNLLICDMSIYKRKINIDQINYITKGKYPVAGIRPALNMKGIIINYKAGYSLFLSPKEQDDFVSKLVEVNPEIKIL